MNTELQNPTVDPDSAAVFAIALSLWETWEELARDKKYDLSECYNGIDQFMREVMRVAQQFEDWACRNVNFDEFNEVWPYYLGDKFGAACLSAMSFENLMGFGEDDCLRVAIELRLPVVADGRLPVPVDLTAINPIVGAGFLKFRIQTLRDSLEDKEPTPYVASDDPFDENFDAIYFSLYGVDGAGLLEHFADRQSYAEVLRLAQKLAPGIAFPVSPTLTTKCAD